MELPTSKLSISPATASPGLHTCGWASEPLCTPQTGEEWGFPGMQLRPAIFPAALPGCPLPRFRTCTSLLQSSLNSQFRPH